METLKKNLANLVKVKTLVTFVVIAVFAVLALQGKIAPDNVMIIVTAVVSFYFGTQHEKKAETEVPIADGILLEGLTDVTEENKSDDTEH